MSKIEAYRMKLFGLKQESLQWKKKYNNLKLRNTRSKTKRIDGSRIILSWRPN